MEEHLKHLEKTAKLIEKYDFIVSKQTKDFASLVKHIEKISEHTENIKKEIKNQAQKQSELFSETEKKLSLIEQKQVKLIEGFERAVEEKITDILLQLNTIEKRVFNLNKQLLLSISQLLNQIIQKLDETEKEE